MVNQSNVFGFARIDKSRNLEVPGLLDDAIQILELIKSSEIGSGIDPLFFGQNHPFGCGIGVGDAYDSNI